MVQVSHTSLPSPSDFSRSDSRAGLLARLQAATLQAEDDDYASFSDPPESSSFAPSILSLRNESQFLTILKERSVEDKITDVKSMDSQPGE